MILNKRKKLLELLNTIPIFMNLSDEDYNQIIPLLVPIVYPKNTKIIKQDNDDDSMFIVKKGTVEVVKELRGKKLSLGVLSPGSYFGELSLIDNLPRSAHVVSREEVEVFRLSRYDFERLLDGNEQIALAFYKNCLKDSFNRFRYLVSNFTFSQLHLMEKSKELVDISKDLSRAQNIQSFVINTNLINDFFSDISYSYINKPSIEIGGDFLNILQYDNNNLGIIIADVEGSGITAAIVTGVLRSAVSIIYKKLGLNTAKFVKYLNKHLINTMTDLHATCCYAVINKSEQTVTFSKAGKNYPLIWRDSKQTFVDFDCKGTGLGLDPDAFYGTVKFKYKPGDKIVLFTNGIINQKDTMDIQFTVEKLKKILKDSFIENEDDILNNTYQRVIDFTGKDELDDDITMTLIEF